jgi:hypothetical protein
MENRKGASESQNVSNSAQYPSDRCNPAVKMSVLISSYFVAPLGLNVRS